MTSPTLRRRSGTLDSLRGLTLVSMMAYHACWDLVYLYGMPWDWYRSFWAYAWQQSICCTFILLSGYCWQMGRHPLRRGLMSFCGGAAVSLVTLVVMPEEPVLHLPQSWYASTLTTALGFPYPGFVSSDYFSLLPWLLLFWTGYHLYRLRPEIPALPDIRLPGLSVISRHSLLLYLLHQPVLYAALVLLPTIL